MASASTCDEREGRSVASNFPDQVPLCFIEDARMRSNSACLPSFLPIPPAIRPFNRILSKYWWEPEMNYFRPSMRYFVQSFQELGVHNWSWAVTFKSLNVDWCVVVILVPRNISAALLRFRLDQCSEAFSKLSVRVTSPTGAVNIVRIRL